MSTAEIIMFVGIAGIFGSIIWMIPNTHLDFDHPKVRKPLVLATVSIFIIYVGFALSMGGSNG
jgi:hypothetical protein